MAVQKSKVSRASRGARRSHDSLKAKGLVPTLSEELETGEVHQRHHISPAGYYKGKQVVVLKKKAKKSKEEASED